MEDVIRKYFQCWLDKDINAAMERRHIARVLEYTKGNKTEAARLLKIGLTTLYRKIEEWDSCRWIPYLPVRRREPARRALLEKQKAFLPGSREPGLRAMKSIWEKRSGRDHFYQKCNGKPESGRLQSGEPAAETRR